MKFIEYVWKDNNTGRYEFYIAPNFVAVHNHRFMRSSNNKRIVSTVRNLMII